MAASYLDMNYHTLERPEEVDPDAFEAAAMKEIGLIDEIIPRYRSTYFQHIFAGGYASGYYGYLWSEVMDADAFQAFKETSLFDQETAQAFRRHILSRGGTAPAPWRRRSPPGRRIRGSPRRVGSTNLRHPRARRSGLPTRDSSRHAPRLRPTDQVRHQVLCCCTYP